MVLENSHLTSHIIPQSLQGAYPRYGIHTSVFAVRCYYVVLGLQSILSQKGSGYYVNSVEHQVLRLNFVLSELLNYLAHLKSSCIMLFM